MQRNQIRYNSTHDDDVHYPIFRYGSCPPKDARKSDRSRQELTNEFLLVLLAVIVYYLLSKIGFDAAENERAKVAKVI